MSEEWKIQYCKFCKEFFLDSCRCHANFQSAPAPSIISGVFAMIRKLRTQTQKQHPALRRQSVEFSRYIDLAPPDSRLNVWPISDVYMYMLTVSGEQKGFSENKSATLSSSSAVSVNSRKSGSGGILKNWMGKTKKKKKKSEDDYNSNPFVEKGDSEDDESDTTQCTISDAIKEAPSKSRIPVLKKSCPLGNVRESSSAIYLKNEALWKYPSHTEINFPICNVPEVHSFDSSMQEVDRIVAQVKRSEMYIEHLISKYVHDSLFKDELLQALAKHSKEAERYTRSFSNDSLHRSNEIARIRETQMQERLNSFIQSNRMLQDDVEELAKKNEKLCVTLQQFSSRERSPDTSSALLETMNRNNDVLRDKVSNAVSKIEHLENYVQKVQDENRVLEEELRDATSQLYTYKNLEQRWDVDHKLKQVQLTQEINKDQELLKESVEAAKLLWNDLDGIKLQWPSTSGVINKAKFSLKSQSLPDLIALFRSCISELSNELQVAHNNDVLKEKSLQYLKDEVARSEEQQNQHKFEENRLRNELKLLAQTKMELQNCKAKLSNAEKTLGEYKLKMGKCQAGVPDLPIAPNFERLTKEAAVEKDEELLLLHEQNVAYKSENDTLRMQLQGLKQALSASGTGEVAEVHEKLATFQSQYYQILSEKNALLEKLHSVSAEKISLGQLQNTTSKFMHAQQQELDDIKKDYRSLRQQFDVEHEQAITLRIERNKLKEEKSVLKQIYLQLKNEINRVQALEGKVIGMNMEANRLTVIADYNKQLGEKLQCEVVERDVKISELEGNMKELNNAQIEYAKDKVALCMELSEVSSLNEKLSKSLVSKHKKLDELHDTKQQIESVACAQLRATERMQKVERAALVELLQDHKRVVAQRDSLSRVQSEYIKQLTQLRANAATLNKNVETANRNHLCNVQIIQNLESKLKTSLTEVKSLHVEIQSKDQELLQTRAVMEEMRKQGQSLEESVSYLQNTIQRLSLDLDKSRESEMELERALQSESKKLEVTENFLIQEKRALEDIRLKDENSRKSIASLTAQHEELLQKHQRVLDELSAVQKEKVRSEELEVELEGKRNQLEELQGCVEKMSADMDQMQRSFADHHEQSAMVVRLQEELLKVNSEHEHSVFVVEEFRKAKTTLDQALQSEMSKVEDQHAYYKNYIENLTLKHTQERDEIENDLASLAEEYDEIRLRYGKLKEEHDALVRKQKGLVGELLTATQMVIDEKIYRFEANEQINQLAKENFRLSSEKIQTDIARESMTNDLKSLQLKISDHNKERRRLQVIVTHLENQNAKLGMQLKTSEENAKLAQDKLVQAESAHKELENSLSDAQNHAYISQEIMHAEKRVFNDSQKMNSELKIEIEKLKHNITALEFQRSEGTLRLHELKVALRTEENINAEMSKMNQEIIGEMLQLDNNDLLPQVLEKFIRS